MSVIGSAIRTFEAAPLPDTLTRSVIRYLVSRTSHQLARQSSQADADFMQQMSSAPIARHTDKANEQHYEVPAEFFARVLGPQRKYSCCFYSTPATTLAEAEEKALELTAAHASLEDGQSILELGCGWGSLSLWMARQFPNATILSVSNSHSQRHYIETMALSAGLTNLRVETADARTFSTGQRFDRVVSVEMFEHMANWGGLLADVKRWLKPDGRLFLHVFSHRSTPYLFHHDDPADWIGQHFFTGGMMPSHDLIKAFPKLFILEQDWRWSGVHYQRTANHWLENFDRHSADILTLFDSVYGKDARLWHRRWRLFFLATAGLFGHGSGDEWAVSHYRLRPSAG